MTKDKKSGVLELRKLNKMNTACSLKLVGKLVNKDNTLWCNVLRSKYNVSNMVDYNSKLTDSKLWKDIIKLKP